MNRRQRYYFIGAMLLLLAAACQVSGAPTPAPTAGLTHSATSTPFGMPSAPAASAGGDMRTPFPSFSLTDPNTVCLQHYLEALSCLDATGWQIYKGDDIPRRIVHCTDGRIYLVDDEIYQYQLEADVLAAIGGWVDQGAVICGRGNDLWVSDYSEVMRYDGSNWTSYAVEDYFESRDDEWPDSIHSLGVAPNGNAWVTTNNSIATFDGSEWELVTPPGNYTFDESSGRSQHLVIDSGGIVWATESSDDRLLKFDGVAWSAFPGPDDGIHGIQIIAVDNLDRIWAATTGTKIFMLNPDTDEWELRFDLEQPGSGNEWEARFHMAHLGLGFGDVNRIHQMEFDGQGRLWVTTNYGLGIYAGETWTIYHDYTANLYMNDISDLYILGDGPRLPPLEYKPFGSVRGKLVSETQTPFADALVAICIKAFAGNSICADQTESVNADGSFVISDVPPGNYFIHFKISNEWYRLVNKAGAPPYFSPNLSYPAFVFTVQAGGETQLGQITAP